MTAAAQPTAGRVERDLTAGICTLTCTGVPDGVFTLDLREELARALERSLPLVVDVGGLESFDADVLSALLNAQRRATRRTVPLVLACGNEQLLRVLDLTGLYVSFPLYPSAEDARADLHRRPRYTAS
jgi:stage II sporulation protein AA (anti-sigma F factor antagonist)